MKRQLVIATATIAMTACSDRGGEPVGGGGTNEVVDAFPKLSFTKPVDLQNAGDGSNRLFVVEHPGRILVFANDADADTARVFLDIRTRVSDLASEEGLLGLAFHPAFPAPPYYYVYYSLDNPVRTRLSRFEVDPAAPDTTKPGSELPLLTIDQPFRNHNGGGITFGSDGFLYIAVGDGGGSWDPDGNGQNLATLLGSILRIDVAGTPYGIPADNPLAGNTDGYREEIYAWGLRNPWRFSFDPVTGWLWAGDVGQNSLEEIDIIEKGGNYGWNCMEASDCVDADCCNDHPEFRLPVWDYEHPMFEGRSVTGGYVYRGNSLPDLVGAYVYGDYMTGEIWALRYDGSAASNVPVEDTVLSISSFGLDEAGELYIVGHGGKIYRIQRG
jgi:glucose/arabinose dehydrogenase